MLAAVPPLCVLPLSGCGVAESEHAKVVQERDSLLRELDELKNGPSRLFASARTALEAQRFADAKQVGEQLIARHPSAPEAKDVAVILQSADSAIATARERERKAAEVRERVRQDSIKARERVRRDSIKAHDARLARALSHMLRSYDDVREIAWYHDRTVPKAVNSGRKVLLYIGAPKGGSPFLRFSIRYTGDSWRFIQGYTIKTDDQTYTITVGYNDVERDNDYSGIFEWYDTSADTRELEIVRAIIRSKHAVIRYNGRQYYTDRVIPAEEKAALQRVLDAYDVLAAQAQ